MSTRIGAGNSANTAQLKQDNAQFLFHPMAHPAAMQKTRPDIIARGEGCWIWDVDGHKMIDGVAGLWSSNLGHSNKAVITIRQGSISRYGRRPGPRRQDRAGGAGRSGVTSGTTRVSVVTSR